MKPLVWSVPLLLTLLGFAQAQGDAPNTLTAKEVQDGWKLLFDGKSLDGWRLYNKKDAGSWTVKDGTIVSGGADLITNDKFADFEFAIDWLFEKGNGNSGLIYRVAETKGPSWQTGPEMQILGGKPGDNLGKNSAGSFYDMIAPSKNTLKDTAKEWNTFKIVCVGKHFEHWVNGEKVIDTTVGSDDWNKAYGASKWKNNKDFASQASGHLCLQDHGSKVMFKNAKVRILSPR